MRALIIDDDADVGAAIQKTLSRYAYETVLAVRAYAGIHALKESKFDVAIVDIFMPGMSGLDTINIIRQKTPGMPIVAMTGYRFRPSKDPETDFLGLAVRRGAAACVRKPVRAQPVLYGITSRFETTRL